MIIIYYFDYMEVTLETTTHIKIQIPPEPLAAHRAEMMSLQNRRSFASSCKSCVFTLIFALSLMMVLPSVSLGLPRFLVPIGVQLKTCLGSLSLSILNTCPRYFHEAFLSTVRQVLVMFCLFFPQSYATKDTL
jgi:hypothetical protein